MMNDINFSKKITFVLIFLLTVFLGSFSFVAGIHKGEVKSDPGLTPESSFYFLDKISEDIKLFFIFNKKTKSLVYVDFISERFSEVESMLSNKKNISKNGLDIAKVRVSDHIDKISKLLSEMQSDGKEVGSIASKMDKNFNEIMSNFSNNIDNLVSDLDLKRQSLKDKIKSKEEDKPNSKKDYFSEIRSTIEDIKFIELQADNFIFSFRDKEEKIEDFMLDINKTKSDLSELKSDFNDLRDEAEVHNLNLPSGYFMTLNYFDFVDEAESQIENLKFNEARESIKKVRESVDSFKDLIKNKKESLFKKYETEITILETKRSFEKTDKISTDSKKSYTRFISEARAEFEAGNYKEAKKLAKQAKEVIIKEN